jgi:endonuclease/exonuclease/phosphatase family metal-dependent hydrolase
MQTLVTVATINLHGRKDRWLERRHPLVAQLIEGDADLIALQELNTPSRQAAWLCRQINMRLSGVESGPYRAIARRSGSLFSGASLGVGVLSRLPVLYHESLKLGNGSRMALRAHVELPSHQTMDFVSTQLHDVPYEREARQEQALRLMGWLHGHKRVPLQIVAGDMQEAPDGLAVAHIKQSFRSAYADVYGREPLATYPTALMAGTADFATCRDYIFMSPAVRRVRAASIFCDVPASEDNTLYPSDHVGLLATVEV